MKTATRPIEDISAIDTLCDAFINRKAVIGIIGLGYVGLPLACAICDKGFKAVGFDVDADKISRLERGQSYIGNIHNDTVSGFVRDKNFVPTADFSKLADVDAIILCVPTPLNKNREPDMTYVEKTARTVAQHLKPGHLVVLESTTWPGTTTALV
ncbi:MAG: NAD(P)-binding domain-containing protein, partial [Alphaproteobacteria bacterium]|nr:NAD(P)-binding domain-containing protein [Alphaproteobacteria bacterium]